MNEPKSRANGWKRSAPLALAVVVLALVVGASLRARTLQGWRGTYFPTRDLAGTPHVRRDPSVAFRWYDESPMPGFPAHDFSVRWETCLTVGDEKNLELYIGSDDGIRIRIDGKTIIDRYHLRSFTADNVPVNLAPGEHYVVVEYFNGPAEAHAVAHFQEAGFVPKPLTMDHYRLPNTSSGGGDPCGR
ncbi:MAG: hypothetical protein HKN10_15795 [Myxococcales bacterium]|nr:hypothetical protein [Myxococcales bacterium]